MISHLAPRNLQLATYDICKVNVHVDWKFEVTHCWGRVCENVVQLANVRES